MPLTLAIHPITEICFGKRLDLEGKRLVVDAAELSRLILEDGAIEAVDFRSRAPARVAARDRSSISSSRELRRRAEVPIGRVLSVRHRRPAAARPMSCRVQR